MLGSKGTPALSSLVRTRHRWTTVPLRVNDGDALRNKGPVPGPVVPDGVGIDGTTARTDVEVTFVGPPSLRRHTPRLVPEERRGARGYDFRGVSRRPREA